MALLFWPYREAGFEMFHVLKRFFRRFLEHRSSIGQVFLVVLLLWVLSAVGFWCFESSVNEDLSWHDALWWSFVTMTTVGYGDISPTTPGGRFIVGITTMVLGIGILGYLISALAEIIIETKSREQKGMIEVEEKDHVLIFHYGGLSRIQQIVGELQLDPSTKSKAIVVIDDRLAELPQELRDIGVKYVRGNPTKMETLERANYSGATHAVILARDPRDLRSDQLNLAVVMTLEELRPDMHTVVECVDQSSIELIRRTGCDSIVCGSQYSSSLLIQELTDPGVKDVFNELSSTARGQNIYVAPIGNMKDWKFQELHDWADEQDYLLLGIKRGEENILNPKEEMSLEKSDKVIVVGRSRPSEISLV